MGIEAPNLAEQIASETRKLIKLHGYNPPVEKPKIQIKQPEQKQEEKAELHQFGTEEEEKAKINSHFDAKYGEVYDKTVNPSLLNELEAAQKYIADHQDTPKELLGRTILLFMAVNALISENAEIHSLNNELNQKVRDLTLEFVKQNFIKATFRM